MDRFEFIFIPMNFEKNWLDACKLLQKTTAEMQKKLENAQMNEDEKSEIFKKFYAENSYLYAVCKSYEPSDDRAEIIEHKIMYLKTKLILEEYQQKYTSQ